MGSPVVSVITPCFNHGRYLGQAIQSVLAQTFADFEIIVVDDGSSDDTALVARSFDDPRVRYVWQENAGLSAARNRGIRAAGGEYVAFLDADDWFLPHKLERQVAFLDEWPEIGLAVSGWIDVDGQGRALREVKPWEWMPELGLVECAMGMPVVPCGVLLRRHWLADVGLFDESLRAIEDWDLYLRLVAGGCRAAWLPEVVCRYRLHGSNMSRDVRRMRENTLTVLNKLYARSDLPEDVRAVRNTAYAVAHVGFAARAYGAGAFDKARLDVSRAIELDPGLLHGDPGRLTELLVSWADNGMLGNEARYLDALAEHLPAQLPSVKREVYRAIGNRYMGQVFDAYRGGDWRTVRACLIRALRLNPSWLLNRGVLSIALRMLVPVLREARTTS